MAARSTLNRVAIAASQSYGTRGATVFDFYRPPVEAIFDLEWFANEASVDMKQGSCQGDLLFRASLEREWCAPDARDKDEEARGLSDGSGHYGSAFASGPWEEWVGDTSYRRRGYFRPIWGRRTGGDSSATAGSVGDRQIRSTELYRNVLAVLALMPKHLREVAVTQHEPRVHSKTMRGIFGHVVPVVALSETARAAFRLTEGKRVAADATVYEWLEGLASRSIASKSRAGEKVVLADAKKEMTRELKEAYARFEDARSELPRNLRFPHHSSAQRARRQSELGS